MLEICCGSYYDALQAASGGAGWVGLNCALHPGGLMPPLVSLELVKERYNVKAITMVRSRGGRFCCGEEDFNVVLRECKHLIRHGANGIASGCLRKNAFTDGERSARMISIIHSHGKGTVFHQVSDCTSNPYGSIETPIELGADRLLTNGLEPKAVEGKALLGALQLAYGDSIEILAGSGISASSARMLMEGTGAKQVHGSCRDWMVDPTTTPNGVTHGLVGPPHTNYYDVVSETLVRQLLDSLGESGR